MKYVFLSCFWLRMERKKTNIPIETEEKKHGKYTKTINKNCINMVV